MFGPAAESTFSTPDPTVNRITAPCVLQGRIPIAVVAQLVEQLIRNQQVSGSNPLNGSRIEVPAKPPETVALFRLLAMFVSPALDC
jgi:hypothetical protein